MSNPLTHYDGGKVDRRDFVVWTFQEFCKREGVLSKMRSIISEEWNNSTTFFSHFEPSCYLDVMYEDLDSAGKDTGEIMEIIGRWHTALVEIEKRCVICGQTFKGVGHHIRSKGAHGSDELRNIMPLCDDHHTLDGRSVHKMGAKTFPETHSAFKRELLSKGWEFCEGADKWVHPEETGAIRK